MLSIYQGMHYENNVGGSWKQESKQLEGLCHFVDIKCIRLENGVTKKSFLKKVI